MAAGDGRVNFLFRDLQGAKQLLNNAIVGNNKNEITTLLLQILEFVSTKTQLVDWQGDNEVSRSLLRNLRQCLVDGELNIRVQACRAVRYLLWRREVLEIQIDLGIPFFISRCLLRSGDSKYTWERMRALKWVKAAMQIAPDILPRCICITLVAIANDRNEEFQRPCLETLRELALVNLELVVQCNGIRTFINSILDPKLAALSTSLTLTLLYILDHPSTRKYLRPGEDIQHLLASFTETESNESGVTREREVAHKALLTIFRSWTGTIYLASSGLRSLTDLCGLPEDIHQVDWTRRCLFHILNEILTPILTTMDHMCWRGPNLLVNYVVLILTAFIKNGFIEALCKVGMFEDTRIAVPARKLLNRIQQIGSRYLPPQLNKQVADMNLVVAHALSNQGVAGTMVSELCERDQVNLEENFEFEDINSKYVSKNLNQQSINVMFLCPETDLNSSMIRYRYLIDNRKILNQELKHMRDILTPFHAHRDLKESLKLPTIKESVIAKIRMDHTANLSESEFDNLLKSTKVLKTKEWNQWDLNQTWNLLNGVLWDDGWFQKALNTRFFKRWLNFFKPGRQQFCTIKFNVNSIRYARIGCQLFRLFTSKQEGLTNTIFCELIDEIVNYLQDQITANDRNDRQDPINPFSKHSIQHTLSCVYFQMIGILTESEQGMTLFHKFSLQQILLKLSNDSRRRYGKVYECSPNDYILGKLLCSFDYVNEKDTRIFFTQYLTSGSINLRKVLLNYLQTLFRCQIPSITQWGIHLLYLQIRCETETIAQKSARVLQWVCTSEETSYGDETLEEAIRCGLHPDDPNIGVLSIRILSSEQGFLRCLQSKSNWLEAEREAWFNFKNKEWIQQQEQAVLNATLLDQQETSNVHFLINDTSGTEEDLQYSEQLFWLPWKLEVTVIYPSSRNEVNLPVYCYFDYDMVLPDGQGNEVPMGCGIVAIILANDGLARPFGIEDNAAVIVRISVSEDSLDDFFPRKTRQRIGRLHERKRITETTSIINKDGVIWMFQDNVGSRRQQSCLSKVFFKIDMATYGNSLVRPMPHFYHQIAQTQRGVSHMMESGDIGRLVEYIKENLDPGTDEDANLNLRGALWALGMFGSSDEGFQALDNMGIVEIIAHETLHSNILSIRSTCLYIIGLFSRSTTGEERLLQLGFMVPAENLEQDLGIALPVDLDQFFTLAETPFEGSWALKEENNYSVSSDPAIVKPLNMREKAPTTAEIIGELDQIEQTTLAHLSALCNIVTLKSSMKALRKIKQKCGDVFRSIEFYRQVLELLVTYNFSLGARRFVLFELFHHVDLKNLTIFEEPFEDINRPSNRVTFEL